MATSLLDWIVDLMRDGSAREAFNTNPQASMATAGFSNVCGEDVADSRVFLFDNPSIREVGGVEAPQSADAPEQIRYIVNNYTIESADVAGSNTVGPTIFNPGPDDDQDDDDNQGNGINGDGNTVDQDQQNSSTQSSSDDDVDSSTNTDQEADNVVTGNRSAGEDQISGTLENFGEGIGGDGNTNVLALADVVDIEHSPFLNDSLNELVDDSANQLAYQALQEAEGLVNLF